MIIVKHQYFSRRDRQSRASGKAPKLVAVERAIAHVKYIQHRPGEDRDTGGRELFNELEDNLDANAIRKAVRKQENSRVVAHKLTLAPEINPANKKAFAREIMHRISGDKGQDLQWIAVEHNNTDHHHVHVVVLGKDQNGKAVRFDKTDYDRIKEYGDRYLERCHPYELEKSRQDRQRRNRERREARQREHELAHRQRVKDGLVLPWMHNKIVREQLEPYAEWKERHDELSAEARQKNDQSFDWKGTAYSKSDSPDKLAALAEQLRKNKEDRLPLADYRRLRSWLEEHDRKRWSGVVDGELVRSEQQANRQQEAENSPAAKRWVDPVQQKAAANPVVGVFVSGASVVNTVVSWVDLRDTRDYLKEQHDQLQAARADRHQEYLKQDSHEARRHHDDAIEKIDQSIDNNKKARQKRVEDSKRDDRKAYDPFKFDPWGQY